MLGFKDLGLEARIWASRRAFPYQLVSALGSLRHDLDNKNQFRIRV